MRCRHLAAKGDIERTNAAVAAIFMHKFRSEKNAKAQRGRKTARPESSSEIWSWFHIKRRHVESQRAIRDRPVVDIIGGLAKQRHLRRWQQWVHQRDLHHQALLADLQISNQVWQSQIERPKFAKHFQDDFLADQRLRKLKTPVVAKWPKTEHTVRVLRRHSFLIDWVALKNTPKGKHRR